ncbi:hypothetical protein E2542_SST17575 [Spatholobus suberectus]|nr:hypothetical protein E2542_SST17575 [Spatholobus suberectus]
MFVCVAKMFLPCKGEVERNVVWLEVMEEESTEINSFSENFHMEIYPLNTKMILGPGFIPPTQLLLFPFNSYLALACPHGKPFPSFHLSLKLLKKNALLQFAFAGSEFSTHSQSCFCFTCKSFIKVVFSLPSF